jgi:segregation and condensation protein B
VRPKPTLAWDDEAILSQIESILLVAGEPVKAIDLSDTLGVSGEVVRRLLDVLKGRLTGGIRLQIHQQQAQLASAPDNTLAVQRFLGSVKPPPLSRQALEALAVVAYRQPATRAEVERARGMNSDRALQTLLARGLIEELGPRQIIGRPLEFGTTFAFLEYFGLSSLADLPPLQHPIESDSAPLELGLRSLEV